MEEKRVEVKETLGMNVYRDTKDRVVVWDRFTKKPYIIGKEEEKRYQILNARLPIAIIVTYLSAYYFSLPTIIWIVIFIGIMLILEGLYRFGFLYNQPSCKEFIRPENLPFFEKLCRTSTVGKLIIMSILSVALAVVSIINIGVTEYSGLTLYLNYGLIVLAIALSILMISALIVKKVKKY